MERPDDGKWFVSVREFGDTKRSPTEETFFTC